MLYWWKISQVFLVNTFFMIIFFHSVFLLKINSWIIQPMSVSPLPSVGRTNNGDGKKWGQKRAKPSLFVFPSETLCGICPRSLASLIGENIPCYSSCHCLGDISPWLVGCHIAVSGLSGFAYLLVFHFTSVQIAAVRSAREMRSLSTAPSAEAHFMPSSIPQPGSSGPYFLPSSHKPYYLFFFSPAGEQSYIAVWKHNSSCRSDRKNVSSSQ